MTSRRISFALLLTGSMAILVSGCSSPASKPISSVTIAPPPTQTPTPSQPAAASVTISSPASGASVASPFTLTASASTCTSQNVASIGYALDGGSSPTIASGTTLSTQVAATSGTHTVQVTAWGSAGATCTASVSVDVTDPTSPVNSLVPSNATSVNSIEQLSNWEEQHDPATGATSSGAMSLVSSPVLTGKAREFNTSFSSSGGEIYHVTFGSDPSSTNFFYDGWVYLDDSAASIANLELDMNQVVANGDTVIYGFQCDGYSGTWDYTVNKNGSTHWLHSSSACDVRNWSRNTWHHVQISYSRDDSGNVTYHSVWLDGTENKIEATAPSEFALGWGSVLLTNFQIDGLGSGSNTVYLNKLTISRW